MAPFSRRKLLLIILRRRCEQRRNKRKARFWVRKIFRERKRKESITLLLKKPCYLIHEYFSRMFRMTPSKFEALLKLVGLKITWDNTRREVINPSERLCVTLRYLLTGDRKVQFCILWSDKNVRGNIKQTLF